MVTPELRDSFYSTWIHIMSGISQGFKGPKRSPRSAPPAEGSKMENEEGAERSEVASELANDASGAIVGGYSDLGNPEHGSAFPDFPSGPRTLNPDNGPSSGFAGPSRHGAWLPSNSLQETSTLDSILSEEADLVALIRRQGVATATSSEDSSTTGEGPMDLLDHKSSVKPNLNLSGGGSLNPSSSSRIHGNDPLTPPPLPSVSLSGNALGSPTGGSRVDLGVTPSPHLRPLSEIRSMVTMMRSSSSTRAVPSLSETAPMGPSALRVIGEEGVMTSGGSNSSLLLLNSQGGTGTPNLMWDDEGGNLSPLSRKSAMGRLQQHRHDLHQEQSTLPSDRAASELFFQGQSSSSKDNQANEDKLKLIEPLLSTSADPKTPPPPVVTKQGSKDPSLLPPQLVFEIEFIHVQLALMQEIGGTGLLVGTDSALLSTQLAASGLERTSFLNMDQLQAYVLPALHPPAHLDAASLGLGGQTQQGGPLFPTTPTKASIARSRRGTETDLGTSPFSDPRRQAPNTLMPQGLDSSLMEQDSVGPGSSARHVSDSLQQPTSSSAATSRQLSVYVPSLDGELDSAEFNVVS